MVLAYHVIVGAYGFWLPNDPRGSWSDFVGSWDLFRAGGRATKTNETKSLAGIPHDWQLRLKTKEALKYPAVQFDGLQARAIGAGFKKYVEQSGIRVWACAILPDHFHLVVARSALSIEQFVVQLKGEATQQLITESRDPFQNIVLPNGRRPKCFARGQCAPFLDSIDDIYRAIQYVENNPLKEGKRRQTWSFVTKFDPTFADVYWSQFS